MAPLPRTMLRTALRTAASGTAVTLLSAVTSCALAVTVEGCANRTLYRFFPHWYKDVQYAYGLPHLTEDRYHTGRTEGEAEAVVVQEEAEGPTTLTGRERWNLGGGRISSSERQQQREDVFAVAFTA